MGSNPLEHLRTAADPDVASQRIISEVYFAICKAFNTPRSLACWSLFREGEFDQLVRLPMPDPESYDDPQSFYHDYLATTLLQKYKGFAVCDTRKVAIQSFVDSEAHCSSMNRKCRNGELARAAETIIPVVQRKISQLLGSFSLYEQLERCRWGPGATASIPRREAYPDTKIREDRLSVTQRCLPFAKMALGPDIHWLRARGIDADGPCSPSDDEFQVVDGGRLAVVPKSAKTDRTILIEPTMNLFLQLGAGSYIRKRLLTVGIDLNDQTRNQTLASLGWATIDLKSASDTVYRELVYQLLPWDYFWYYDSIRSPFYKEDAESGYKYLQKFSSMGNGFTFELESLIFWAIAQCVLDQNSSRERCGVFGDDIAVPLGFGNLVVEHLEAFGFQVNRDKSFTRGPFRESCGRHYFNGTDVTPIYQKEIPSSYAEIIRLHNRLYRASARLTGGDYYDRRFRGAVEVCRRHAPPRHVTFDLESDDGFFANSWEDSSLLPYVSRRWVVKPRMRDADDASMLANTLRRISNRRSLAVEESTPYQGQVPLQLQSQTYVSRRRSPWDKGSISNAPWI
jgi:hypothetical protein